MILIISIILYFMQITHTDHFPSTGTRLVSMFCCILALIWRMIDSKIWKVFFYTQYGIWDGNKYN